MDEGITFLFLVIKKVPHIQGVPFFLVCRAWQITRRWKSVMGVCGYLPLANSKGVHREVESEGSCRQIFEPTNRNFI